MVAVIDLVEAQPVVRSPACVADSPRHHRRHPGRRLARALPRSPQRTALIFEDERWSYAELHRAACQAARQTVGVEGLTRGDRVILMMDNGPAFVSAFFGCQLIGVVPIPVSPNSSVQRVRYLLADSEASLVLVEPSLPERVRSLHRAQAYGARVVMLEPQHVTWEPHRAARRSGRMRLHPVHLRLQR